jgi:hypothetical protein
LPDKLIIFDYSGTLSLEAAAFSRPDNLMQHLKNSGLFTLGVNNAALFWEIVNATWQKGSTTRLGYKTVMQARIAELFPKMAAVKQPEISKAVANFVDTYLDQSLISEYWRVILQRLSADKSVQVIIATDHYAEATDAIIAHLGKWDIPARPLTASVHGNFIVANSADIGTYKSESKFWETIKTSCGISACQILMIDDFGANEQRADAYAKEKEIVQRRQKTISLLESVFLAQVECFVFAATNTPITDLASQVSEKIIQYLSDKSNT